VSQELVAHDVTSVAAASTALDLAQSAQAAPAASETATSEVWSVKRLQALLDAYNDVVGRLIRRVCRCQRQHQPSAHGQGDLGQALDALYVQRGPEEMEALMSRIDINCDVEIHYDEFRSKVQWKSPFEILMQTTPLLRSLAHHFAGTINQYRKISDSEGDQQLLKCVPVLGVIVQENLRAVSEMEETMTTIAEKAGTAGEKFAFTVQDGTLQDNNDCVTGRVSEPRACKEH